MKATVLFIKRESSHQKKTHMNGEKDKCWLEIHCKNAWSKEVFGKCVYLIWFAFVRIAGNQGHDSRKVYSLKNLWADWYW